MKKEEKKFIVDNESLLEGIKKDDFKFVHDDGNIKIHDEAFKTKPTTFIKDAFKRFCKNKSSVVAAVIIGILLLGSFIVPLVSPHDIHNPETTIALLDGKLFNAGTGFWDGTKKYTHKPWDGTYENEDGTIGKPAGDFLERAVVKKTVVVNEVEYVNQPYKYAADGYALIVHENKAAVAGKNLFYQNYEPFAVTADDNYKLTINFASFDGASDLPIENLSHTEHRILLNYAKSKTGLNNNPTSIVISDWSNQTGEFEFSLSDALKAKELEEAPYCRIRIEGRYPTGSERTYFSVKSAVITSDKQDEETKDLLNAISINSANFTICNDRVGDDPTSTEFSKHYWQSNGIRTIYHAEIRYVSFRYDHYEAVLGMQDDFIIGGSLFEEYKAKGYCTYDKFENLHETFKITDKRCPVEEVNGPGEYNEKYGIYQWKCQVVRYKYLGYTHMPRFLFGTDINGFDMFTKALNCLKTSLLVAIISSAVCLAIGLIWGAISGYYGGTVDIVMERITDIISGVPWIVMMTLIILLLGNNIVTFAFALVMTGWIGTASLTRTQFYRFKGREYVLASRTLGARDGRLIFKHILPNALGTIVTSSVLMIPSCIFSEATISYLGLGLAGVDSFGVLMSDNQIYLSSHPTLVILPAIIISLLMISFNLFGNGLRDALNPSLKGED